MPINIFDEDTRKSIDWICDDEWEMPSQIEALEEWLSKSGKQLGFGNYAADVGYSPRVGACGGGIILSTEAMAIMVKIGMVLQLSEYPVFVDDYSLEVGKPNNGGPLPLER